jgi:hypothetical protein
MAAALYNGYVFACIPREIMTIIPAFFTPTLPIAGHGLAEMIS